MNTYTIRGQFEVGRPPAEVRRWLDNTNGIAGWWSDGVEGDASAVGDRFRVKFPTTDVVFELEVTAMSDEAVEWHIPESPPWWRGTRIRFGLTPSDEATVLAFTHGEFDAEDPIIPVITPAWVRFVDNLVAVAETGAVRPAVVN